jgi:uncharacterized protein with HEPN domain
LSRSVALYLEDIADCCRKVLSYSRTLDLESFLQQDMAREAILYNLQTIGEAAGHLPDSFLEAHPNVDWRGAIALRHVIVHGYSELNYDIVWSIVTTDVPSLLPKVEAMISEEPPEEQS